MTTTHQHDHASVRHVRRRVLWIVLAANAGFAVAEVVGGIAFGSLALLADAAHMMSDVAGIGIALIATFLAERPPSDRHTYGLQRAEVLGAQANGILLIAATLWIAWEAVDRIGSSVDIDGWGVVAVAGAGLAVNLVSLVLLHRQAGQSLNMRGAALHMAGDAAGSVAAVAAGVAVLVWGAEWVDPVASLLIAALVLWSVWGLMAEATHVLLEGTPRGLDEAEVVALLERQPGIEAVHHVHLWSLASEVRAMSAHVVLTGDVLLHDAQRRGEELKALLRDRFAIEHATLELECHECEVPDHEVDRTSS